MRSVPISMFAFLGISLGCALDRQGKDKCASQSDCLDGSVCNLLTHTCETQAGQPCATTQDCDRGTCENHRCLPGRWSTVAPMPTPRAQLAAVLAPGFVPGVYLIYAIGGYTENGAPTGVVEVYDPMANSWSAVDS